MKVVKAAAVQLSPVLYGREGTIEKIVGKILQRTPSARQTPKHSTAKYQKMNKELLP
jgi:hypothetical protein